MTDAIADRVLATVLAGVGLNLVVMLGSFLLNWRVFAYRLRSVEDVIEHVVERVGAIEICCAATHHRKIVG